jgi:hypothetical protein
MNDLTVIYYTSNREKPKFEEKIREALLKSTDGLPIISVSQKPIDLGENICVGNVGKSTQNAFRQAQIGMKAAKTKFVCTVESDSLYPKEYFQFIPPKNDVMYVPQHIFVLFAQKRNRKMFARKSLTESAIVCGRKYLIETIGKQLEGMGQWSNSFESGAKHRFLLNAGEHDTFKIQIPIITFKTDENLHRKTPHSRRSKTYELPGWGNSHELLMRYCRE